MCVRLFVTRVGTAEESGGTAINGDEQHLFAAPSQPFGPVTQALDGEPEVAEERGIAKNNGMSADGSGDAHPARVLEAINMTNLDVALASAVDDGGRDGCVEARGGTGGEGEQVCIVPAGERNQGHQPRSTIAGGVGVQSPRVVQHGVEDTDAASTESFRLSGIFLVEFFPMPEGASPVYRFGPFAVDVADRSLKRADVAIPLTPKHFDLLVALISNAGRLVEKDTLLKSVWPDVAVEEGNLTKGIFTLRQLIEQEGSRYIETVPKRGYRFAGVVTREAPAASALSTASPDVSAAPAESASAALENSIAVMPFTDMSAARDQEFFCEGMSEEIINALGRVPDLRVSSYTSSVRFKSKAVDPQSIGKELMVSWLLEGSVRKSGDMVRIAVQLVRASDGFSAWSGRFDRRLDDIFTVQDDIAGMIAETLTRRVAKAAPPLVTSTTSSTEAYSLYLEGRYLWNKRPGDVVWQALDRFERAIAIDPSFAPAYAALASLYGTLGAWESGVLPPAEALAKAKIAARRALELDPQLAAGHTAVGYTRLHFDWNADQACKEFDQAIALNPAWVDAHHWHSHALCAAARFPESLAACRRIVELDPLNPLMHAHIAWHHYMARDFAAALAQAERVVRMEPSFHWGHFFAGWALERLGRGAEAIAALEEAVRCSSTSPVMLAGLGHALAALQDRRDALRVADDLQRLRAGNGLFAYEIGVIHAALGDRDQAFSWLTRAVHERSGWIAYLRVDPRLDALHRDSRFDNLSAGATNKAT
jgi:TolB-like protein/Tfp pilus assembly protein PilF